MQFRIAQSAVSNFPTCSFDRPNLKLDSSKSASYVHKVSCDSNSQPGVRPNTIVDNYTVDDYFSAITDCASMLKGCNEQVSREEIESLMLEVNCRVGLVPGLKFYEDPPPSAEERDQHEVSKFAEPYRKSESQRDKAFSPSTPTSDSAQVGLGGHRG